jgi:hypothetical protein
MVAVTDGYRGIVIENPERVAASKTDISPGNQFSNAVNVKTVRRSRVRSATAQQDED